MIGAIDDGYLRIGTAEMLAKREPAESGAEHDNLRNFVFRHKEFVAASRTTSQVTYIYDECKCANQSNTAVAAESDCFDRNDLARRSSVVICGKHPRAKSRRKPWRAGGDL